MVIVKNQEPFLKKTISFSELVKAVRVTLYRKWNTPAVFRNIPKSVGNFVMTVEQEQVVYGPECGNRCSAPPEKVQASVFSPSGKIQNPSVRIAVESDPDIHQSFRRSIPNLERFE